MDHPIILPLFKVLDFRPLKQGRKIYRFYLTAMLRLFL
jgi:hypothetical protein